MKSFKFLLGSRRLGFRVDNAADVMNICMRHSLVYDALPSREGEFSVAMRILTARKLEALCLEADIEILKKEDSGFPAILWRYRKRYGIFLGAILFCLIIVLSRLVLWDVRIEGEARLTESEVKKALAECGLTVGTPLHKLKTDKIEAELLMRSDTISWVSVNMRGTVAHVEIREHEYPGVSQSPRAANLIAACDGTIVGFEEVRGNIVVSIGDLVREGELLVSGIYDSDTLGFNVTAAEGKVYARLTEEISIEIPLEYEEKVYTGQEFIQKSIIFYLKEIKFYTNCRNLPPKCDTIDTVEYLSFYEGGELPFGVRTVRHREYEYVTKKRTPEEAIDEAFLALRRELDSRGATDILRKSFSYELTDTAYILHCEVDYVKNIAIQVEIPYKQN